MDLLDGQTDLFRPPLTPEPSSLRSIGKIRRQDVAGDVAGIEPEATFEARPRGRVEVIVDVRIANIVQVDAVHVVSRDQLLDDFDEMIAHLGQARRKVTSFHPPADQIDPAKILASHLDAVGGSHEPLRMLMKHVTKRFRHPIGRMPGEERVDPGVHLDPGLSGQATTVPRGSNASSATSSPGGMKRLR